MKDVFWNGNGVSMLSADEREHVESGDQCHAGRFRVDATTGACYVDQHVVGQLAGEDADRPPLAARIRAANGEPEPRPDQSLADALAEVRAMRDELARKLNRATPPAPPPGKEP